jgi:LPXTG-site transpeptidase (sortase) family protein
MNAQKLNEMFSTAYRQYARVLAVVVVGMVIGASVVFIILPDSVAEAPTIHVNEHITTTSAKFTRSAPVHIVIPKIGLDTTFVPPLGLLADKTVAVPDNYTEVGWYEGGASPGEVGASVILGHVDSYEGPAVFYKLGKLETGDDVEIARVDGTTATFEVQSIERYARKDFPTQLVYGKTDEPVLRLVTCSGTFNKGKQEYSHNLVVYATLKK